MLKFFTGKSSLEYDKALELIKRKKYLLICAGAGAGIGVDSGLQIFVGKKDFGLNPD